MDATNADQIILSHSEVMQAAWDLALALQKQGITRVYPVPRGGVPVAYLLKMHYPHIVVLDTPSTAEAFVDDLIDSGKTRDSYKSMFPDLPFFFLFDKASYPGRPWLIFPWESDAKGSAEDIPIRLLQYIGEDPAREGLRDTPARFLKAWKFWTKGYAQNPDDVLKVFEDGAENYDEMVIVRDIPVYSFCEHHLAQIVGTAAVAYVPNKKIVGLSKIARVVDIFARRLQVQERLTSQIADCLEKHLQPKGVAVLIKARHMCMESRGVERAGAITVTSALRGCLHEGDARAEFLKLASTKET